MEKFSLDEYLKNPQRKVITREGLSVRIICTDRVCDNKESQKPIMALVNFGNKEVVYPYTSDGISSPLLPKYDLFFDPNQKICPLKRWDRVLVRDSHKPLTSWRFDIFQEYEEGERHPYVCIDDRYEQCIPFNENTWKLLGTANEYKE